MIRQVRILLVGSCTAPSRLAGMGGWGRACFPAACALIEHGSLGPMLFDTGYGQRFFGVASSAPESLYTMAMPVTLPAVQRLPEHFARCGFGLQDIGTVVLSHLHVDHVGGLLDLPHARIIAGHIPNSTPGRGFFRRLAHTTSGFMPALLPEDFSTRCLPLDGFPQAELPQWMAPFRQGYDLYSDGGMLAVPLPRHAPGHFGLLLPKTDRGAMFFVGDACWSLPDCKAGRMPSGLVLRMCGCPAEFRATYAALGELARREADRLLIVPAHCAQTLAEVA